jgi:hypothetical protein
MRRPKAKRTRPTTVEAGDLETTSPGPVPVSIEGEWTVPIAPWAAIAVTPHARGQRVTLDVHVGAAVVWTDDVVLTSAMERRRFCKQLAAARGIAVTESALLALHVALHGPPVDLVALAEDVLAKTLAEREAIDPLLAEAEAQDWRDSTGMLLDRIDDVLLNYVAMLAVHRTVIALWSANTHVYRVRGVVPYLHIVSATPESGKTLVFDIITPIVRKGEMNIGSTEAVIFRTIEAEGGPTLLLDEVDDYYTTTTPESVAVRAILRSGYKQGAYVRRCVGEDFTPKRFSTYCPKAFAGVRDILDAALRGRCIIIRQQKRRDDEPVGDFRIESYEPVGRLIGEAFETWAPHAAAVLAAWEPDLPAGVRDRNAELWRPLLAIAELAGEPWRTRCLDAIHALVKDLPENRDVRVLLLAAFREMFSDLGDKVCSAIALELLIEREMEPWGKWWADDVQRARRAREGGDVRAYAAKATASLAGMLRAFGILPKQVRLGAGTLKGYDRADFEDAFARHLSLSTPSEETASRNGDTTLAAQGAEGVSPGGPPEGGGNTGKPCGTWTVSPFHPSHDGKGGGSEKTTDNGAPPPAWRCTWCRSTTRFDRGDHWVCGGCHHRTPREAREPGIEG